MSWEQYFVQGIELLYLSLGSYLDLKNRLLPVKFLLLFGFLGLFCNLCFQYQHFGEMLAGILPGSMFLLIGKLTKEEIGYGDGTVIMTLGLYEGFRGILPVITGAFMLSGFYGICSLLFLKKSRKDSIPFLPFLFVLFVGVRII